MTEYIGRLQENDDIIEIIEQNQNLGKKNLEKETIKLEKELAKTVQGIETMEEHIPEAMTGDYALSLTELMEAIHKQKQKKRRKKHSFRKKQKA